MSNIRPNLSGLSEEQRTLALASWWMFRLLPMRDAFPDALAILDLLHSMENLMEPETLHRLALCRGRFWREHAQKETT